ncbi:hypothetical protein SAMN06266787_1194 [Halorubrum ezzemoulense]|uniref:Uncharacterized protein n=1 Tax=Halorubrum ezzemoulense TaxID=337243 RepID=A0A238YUK8_HALEZ|nr:hypothetical protein SAMN06266787_1194 [Halorubrum ezzemoulense]
MCRIFVVVNRSIVPWWVRLRKIIRMPEPNSIRKLRAAKLVSGNRFHITVSLNEEDLATYLVVSVGNELLGRRRVVEPV